MAFQLFPSFSFNESNVGPRPVRSVTRERVAIAAVFNRGPFAPAVVDSLSAPKLYNYDASVGSAHLQAIFDQGVPDALVVPVRPSARFASLNATIAGTVSGAGTLTVTVDTGSASTNHVVTLTGAETGSAVAEAVLTQLQADAAPIVVALGSGNSGTQGALVFTAPQAGTAGNSLKVEFALATSTGLTFTPSGIGAGEVALTGGIDAPTAATLTLSDASSNPAVTLTLTGPGNLGDGVTAQVTPSIDSGKFNLTLAYAPANILEVYPNVDPTDVYDTNKLSALKGSMLATGQVVDATKTPAPNTNPVAFSGGTDGDPILTTQDFLDAIAQFENIQCTILTCPGLKPSGVVQGDIDAALVEAAETNEANMGELVGLRIAVTSTPRGTQVGDIAGIRSSGGIIPSQRNVMVMGWGTSQRVQSFPRFGIDPAAPYAGHLVMTPNYISPAARTSSPTIKGISEVDTPVGNSAWNTITQNRLEAIILDPTLAGFHCLNGLCTSADPAWSWICVRRIYDECRTDIFWNFQWIKSEPSSASLDRILMQGIDTLLDNKLRSGRIAGYNPTVSNDTNNTPADRAAGRRFVDIYIEPVYPNDQTQWNINRVQGASIRMQVA